MRKLLSLAVAGSVVLAIAVAAVSPTLAGPADTIKYRQNAMKANAAISASLNAIAKGEVKADAAAIQGLASALAGLAKATPSQFPEDSKQGDTVALPAIWEKPAEFSQAVTAFITATANLEAAAKTGDMKAVADAQAAVGRSCGGCHQAFRGKRS